MNTREFGKPKEKLRRHDDSVIPMVILDMTETGCSYILTKKNTISVFFSSQNVTPWACFRPLLCYSPRQTNLVSRGGVVYQKRQYRFSILYCDQDQNRRPVSDREQVDKQGRKECAVASELTAACALYWSYCALVYGGPKTIHTALILIANLVNCNQASVGGNWGIGIEWKGY